MIKSAFHLPEHIISKHILRQRFRRITPELGIGVTPTNTLHVNGHMTLNGLGGSTSAPTRVNTDLLLYGISDTNWAGIGTDGNGYMYFVTGSSAPATRMTILTDGKVGIGMTPTVALDVNGGASVSAGITVGTTSTTQGLTLNNSTASYTPGNLNYYEEGTFTATGTGFNASVTGTAYFVRVGKSVTLMLPYLTGTSNANTFTITGLPTRLQPARRQDYIVYGKDSGLPTFAELSINGATITLYKHPYDVWTASGIKEIGSQGTTLVYLLN